MKQVFTSIMMLIFISISSQNNDFTSNLYETYDNYKESSLINRRIKYKNIKPLIDKLKEDSKYTIKKVGESIEGRELNLVSVGEGDINVFLWSQMHGDEPTATQAIFDIFNFLNSNDFLKEKEAILSKLTLHFLPMLNPDGAEKYTRRNALGIDMNRDALRLQSPESRTLKNVRDSLKANFGFNLHDQSIYYNAERTDKVATISYLAPAYNYEKEINEVRANAMKVIVFMNQIIQKYAPGQVGRYNDDFEPRAFGDNIQKWGTSTILIESGGYKNDVEKQEIRKLNYVSILAAIYTIANGTYKDISVKDYEKIPQNDRKLFDLKIQGTTYQFLGKDYVIDLGINRFEVDDESYSSFYNLGRIIDQGDLSTFFGYETLAGKGYSIEQGKVYPETLNSIENLSDLDIYQLLKNGYTYLRVENLPVSEEYLKTPIHLIGSEFKIPELKINVGANPTFLLRKDKQIKYAIINGFLIDLNSKENNFNNALIFRN